MAFMILSPVEK